MKLNVGAGEHQHPGYTPVDRKLGSEAYPLSYADGSADEIRASHILEHFDWRTVPKVLADWYRVLKPGGVLKVAVPDMQWISKNLHHPHAPYYIMGSQSDENDYHKTAWTPNSLTTALTGAGFENIGTWETEIKDCASLPVSLNLCGTKPLTAKRNGNWPDDGRPRISAVISMPRLCFSDMMHCAVTALGSMEIPLTKVTGAFWDQCLERGLKMAIEEGAEWLLTMDYDTVFDVKTLQDLLTLMADHPEADAIAPVQIKREEDFPLIMMEDEHGKRITRCQSDVFEKPLVQAASAHFGLTLLRVESLQKMKHPWFLGVPNEAGEWGENRTDPDIYFWRKWKEIGNTLFIAPKVRVGHCQLMVTWPGANLTPIHQYCTDYNKNGAPNPSSFPLPPVRSTLPAAPGGGEKVGAQ